MELASGQKIDGIFRGVEVYECHYTYPTIILLQGDYDHYLFSQVLDSSRFPDPGVKIILYHSGVVVPYASENTSLVIDGFQIFDEFGDFLFRE